MSLYKDKFLSVGSVHVLPEKWYIYSSCKNELFRFTNESIFRHSVYPWDKACNRKFYHHHGRWFVPPCKLSLYYLLFCIFWLSIFIKEYKFEMQYIFWNDLKTHRFFICVFFFRFEGKIVKLKIIKFFCLFKRTAFAAIWIDLPVMRKFLGQKWQNHNFGNKTVSKNLFSLDFS